jgi:excisionase family DNA binding protein
LSVSDVARRLAVSKATVYGLCSTGKLRNVRLLNIIRVRPEDLRVFVETAVASARSDNPFALWQTDSADK